MISLKRSGGLANRPIHFSDTRAAHYRYVRRRGGHSPPKVLKRSASNHDIDGDYLIYRRSHDG